MKENDHTKLLLSFLRYANSNGQYRVLSSFLKRFTQGKGAMIHYKKPLVDEISFSRDFIDGLIVIKANQNNKYAVIIENKIDDAPDQDDQIRRYIKHVKEKVTNDLNNIWVLYLTSDNSKEIGENSYDTENNTQKAYIGNRFIQLTYSEDIINWLKEDVLGMRIYPESLTSVVRAYVDYLEDRFNNANVREKMQVKNLCNKLKIGDIERISEEKDINKLYAFKEDLSLYQKESDDNIIDELYKITRFAVKELEDRAFRRFEEITATILNEQLIKNHKRSKLVWKVARRGNFGKEGYIQIRLTDDWGTVHMEWTEMSTIKMLCETDYNIKLHVERNKPLAKEFIEQVNKLSFPTFKCGVRISRNGGTCIFNYNVSTGNRPFGRMKEKDLTEFLKQLYIDDMNSLFELMIQHIDDYKDINAYNKKGTT